MLHGWSLVCGAAAHRHRRRRAAWRTDLAPRGLATCGGRPTPDGLCPWPLLPTVFPPEGGDLAPYSRRPWPLRLATLPRRWRFDFVERLESADSFAISNLSMIQSPIQALVRYLFYEICYANGSKLVTY
jgi:hypothetical protein